MSASPIYTFRNGKLEGTKSNDEIDNNNSFILNGSFFAHIGEAKEWDEDSRVEIYNWNGHDWIQQVFHEFDDDDPVDAPAFGSDYFATRYLDKRVLHGFSVENGLSLYISVNPKNSSFNIIGENMLSYLRIEKSYS